MTIGLVIKQSVLSNCACAPLRSRLRFGAKQSRDRKGAISSAGINVVVFDQLAPGGALIAFWKRQRPVRLVCPFAAVGGVPELVAAGEAATFARALASIAKFERLARGTAA